MEQTDLRMILCDVDGTLLKKGCATISKGVFSAIRSAADANIRFVIARGRCYSDLAALFSPVLDIVTLIANDGAIAVQNGNVLFDTPIFHGTISPFLKDEYCQDGASLVMYGMNHTYGFGNCACPHALSPYTDGSKVYKLAFHQLSMQNQFKVRTLATNSGKLTEIYSGNNWLEFIWRGIDKGVACAKLQKHWGISPFQTAAFGDNTNDFEMLRQARLSFASPTAISEIKKMCKYSTNCVVNEILKLSQERGTL